MPLRVNLHGEIRFLPREARVPPNFTVPGQIVMTQGVAVLIFALSAYFAGAVTLGGLTQLSGAFGRVTQTLSWFIFSYRELAEFAAVAQSLDDLMTAAGAPGPMAGAARDFRQDRSADGALHVSGLHLQTPQGRWLVPVPDRVVHPGERIWINGVSGQGKSTLLAALSGLWCYGKGRIATPASEMVFLPQKPHLDSDGLAGAACYPRDPGDFAPDRIAEVLKQVGLEHRLDRLDEAGPGALEGLSMGERQRLVLARVLLLRPDWIILDEATSSLDALVEAELLSLIRRDLPEATILCVSHRDPAALGVHSVWCIGEGERDDRKTA